MRLVFKSAGKNTKKNFIIPRTLPSDNDYWKCILLAGKFEFLTNLWGFFLFLIIRTLFF